MAITKRAPRSSAPSSFKWPARIARLWRCLAGLGKAAAAIEVSRRWRPQRHDCCAYATQVEALRRLRNGGSQIVRVEHVHVNEGGQAVTGNVKSSGSEREGVSAGGGYAPTRYVSTACNASVTPARRTTKHQLTRAASRTRTSHASNLYAEAQAFGDVTSYI